MRFFNFQYLKQKVTLRKLLFVPGVLLVAFLLLSTKPWSLNIGEEIAAGNKVQLDSYISDGLWWAALANLFLVILLIFTEPYWNTRLQVYSEGQKKHRAAILPMVLILLAMVVGSYWRVPYLDHSWGNDEEWAMRHFVHGYYKTKDHDNIKYRQVKWKETFFLNTGTNNHVAQSVAARLSLEGQTKLLGNSDDHHNEVAERLPSFIAGLLSIGAIGYLLCIHGSPLAGVTAAWFLMLNPWHLRYSVEARGYSFLILFAILALMALSQAIRIGKWRYWLLFGFFQFMMMWSFSGSVYLAVTMNLGALLAIQWPSKNDQKNRYQLTARWLVANVISAMIFIQLMGPSIRQIARKLGESERRGTMGGDWVNDLWCHLSAGVRWGMDDVSNPYYLSLLEMTQGSPLKYWFFFGVLPLLCVLGVLRLFAKRSPTLWIAAGAPWLAGLLAYAHNSWGGTYMFTWYLIFLLIGMAVCLALAVEFCTSWISKESRRKQVQIGVAIVFIALYSSLTAFPRYAMRDHSRQPLREVVAVARGAEFSAFGESGGDLVTVAFGSGAHQFRTYDPLIRSLSKMDDEGLLDALKVILSEAKVSKKQVVVIYADHSRADLQNPKLVEFVNNPAVFQERAVVSGLEALFSYRVMESK